jgi:hypothetical protein
LWSPILLKKELINVPKQKPQDEVNEGTEQKNEEPSAGELSSDDQSLSGAVALQTNEPTPTTESIKPTTEKPDVEEVKPEPEVVTLKGWEDGREGTHSIHTKKGVFNFVNGKASFSSVIATELREAGYIE